METVTKAAPEQAAENYNQDITPAAEGRNKYEDYADIILGADERKLSERKYSKFVGKIEEALSSEKSTEEQGASLEEVIDNMRTPTHKKIGQFVNTKMLNLYDRVTSAPGNAIASYREKMDDLKANKETDSRTTRVKKWFGRAALRGKAAVTVAVPVAGIAAYSAVAKDYSTTHSVTESIVNTANSVGNVYSFGGNGSGGFAYLPEIMRHSELSEGRNQTLITRDFGDIEMGGVVPGQNTSANESNVNMANRAAEEVARNGEGADVFVGHSQGTMAIAEYFEANELDADDQVVLIGGPYVPGERLSENDIFRTIKPAADAADVNIGQELPGGENVLYVAKRNDLIALSTNGKNNPGDILNRIVGSASGNGHNYSAADIDGTTAHRDVVNEDGSTTRIVIDTGYRATDGSMIESGIGAGMSGAGMPVTAEQDDFFEAIRGEEDGRWNMQEVADTGAAAAEQVAPGTGQIVQETLSTPQVQEVADTYMDTQDQFFATTAEAAETNPAVQEVQTQVAEVWTEVATAVAPHDYIANTPVQEVVEAVTPIEVPQIPQAPAEVPPVVHDFSEAINNFQVPQVQW